MLRTKGSSSWEVWSLAPHQKPSWSTASDGDHPMPSMHLLFPFGICLCGCSLILIAGSESVPACRGAVLDDKLMEGRGFAFVTFADPACAAAFLEVSPALPFPAQLALTLCALRWRRNQAPS